MIIDKENLLSYKQAITVTANSDTLDLGPPQSMTGSSGTDREIPMFMHIDEPFAAAGAATLTIELQTASDLAFTSPTTFYRSGAIAKADLTAPRKWPANIGIPADVKQFVRAVYTVTTGPFTAGRITLGVTADRQLNF